MNLRTRRSQGWILVAVVTVAVALLLVVSKTLVQAQNNAVTLGISPQLLDVTANPGETLSNTFRLTNGSEDTINIRVTPKNFTPRGEEGAVDLTEDRTSFSLADWLEVDPLTVTILPNQTQDFNVDIVVPSNAEPGSHFGSVVFQTIPPEQEGASALVSQEIAPVILVRIAGDTTESAEIEEFKTEKGFYSNQTNINLVSRIKNTGNVHFMPNGKIQIKNMFGNEVANIDLDRRNVLPDSIRQITNNWAVDGFTMGRYTATLTIVFGEDNEIQTAQTSFIIFPYQTVIPIVIVVCFVGFMAYKGRKRLTKAAQALSGKDSN